MKYNGEADNEEKITHSVLFVAVLAGTTALTLFAGRGNLSSTIYNFVFSGGDRSPVSDRNVLAECSV